MFELRDYQKESVYKAMRHLRSTNYPIVLDLATGAGKSLIIAEIAKQLFEISGKKVLCLAPSRELVVQNYEKYISYGNKASIFSASAGIKDTSQDVIFGSPQSVKNAVSKFKGEFSAIIIDECHGITATIKRIVSAFKEQNSLLRVIGLTATPYRMGSGYIYELDENGVKLESHQTKEPYFKRLVHRVTAHELIKKGYLTQPVTELVDGYDTSKLVIGKNNQFTSESIDRAFVGKGRLTSKIVQDVVSASVNRNGVMFFASTIDHANEILESLPRELSALITGETHKKERERIINNFKAMDIKYLVNVSVLTTGFDAPHVDVIAILRATESASLFQQIIGRGLRLYDEKENCLILDFADNIKRHELKDDLFTPQITTKTKLESKPIKAICETCGGENSFSARPNTENLGIDESGYFLDIEGDRIIDYETQQAYPAHYGRRCQQYYLDRFDYVQCSGRWSMKICPSCSEENDISARRCIKCNFELVNPNKKLHTIKKIKSEILHVNNWKVQKWKNTKGGHSLRVDYYTNEKMIPIWYFSNGKSNVRKTEWNRFCYTTTGCVFDDIDDYLEAYKSGLAERPRTIVALKSGNYYSIINYNFEINDDKDIWKN